MTAPHTPANVRVHLSGYNIDPVDMRLLALRD
jgi:hypothetical protein